MMEFLVVYSLIIATVLVIGETVILIKTEKYWPLSLDDYLVCAALFYCAATLEQNSSQYILLVSWGFMAGNLYAMLFTRMDPNGGSRERLGLLSIMLGAALIGAFCTIGLLLQ